VEEYLGKTVNVETPNVDAEVNLLTAVITDAASATFRQSCSKKRVQKRKMGKHFDTDCHKFLRNLKNMGRLLSRDPKNYHLRKTFYYNKRVFKKMVKKKLETRKNALVQELNSHDTDPKYFWKILENLNECTHGSKIEKDVIPPNIWMDHFQSLMVSKDEKLTEDQEKVVNYVNDPDNWKSFNELSYRISDKEIIEATRLLKRGKACGVDLVSNEMLKCGITTLLPLIVKVFNSVLSEGVYPSLWSGSWLKPLHKNGDWYDPNRYRGISIMSCVGKLFCTVLNRRLVKFTKANKLNSKVQIGFSEDCRTSDHILTLKTLTDKYSQENRKLYACFIDFKKAFDSVWRSALFYKLLKYDISGPFAKVIQNMYSKSSTQVKLKSGLTECINDNVGVKQGCVLSPTLFKLFINDIANIFDNTCHPVKLHEEYLNCLLFADDLVLLADSKIGLQNALDRLSVYCKSWKLNINLEKTKTMIFSKSGKTSKDLFTLDHCHLENVSHYTYLGIVMSSNGSFTSAISTLSQKAMKAMFKLRGSLYQTNTTPQTSLSLYDTLIRPIATYGCEVWGAFMKPVPKLFDIDCKMYKLFDEPVYEKLELKFMKSILGVNKRSVNAAVRGELGRYPMTIYVLKQVLKNWFRLANYHHDSILHDAYLCNMNLLNEGKKCWLQQIYILVKDTLGLQHIWENHGHVKYQKTHINTAVKNMRHIFHFQWLNEVNGHNHIDKDRNKLANYALFKHDFQYENYLNFEVNFKRRRPLTRLRISAHKLEIETGRYAKKDKTRTERKDRLCRHCTDNEVEDEEHVIMKCPKYDQARAKMLRDLADIYPDFILHDVHNQYLFIISCFDSDSTSLFADMIEHVVTSRGCL
jgi:hypothetical protein